MRPIYLLLGIGLLIITNTFGQTPADARIKIQKANVPGSTIELPYSSDVTENAIRDYYSKKGIRSTNSRGFMVFKNAPINNGTETGDVYFNVDRKSRKDKEISVVQMFVVKPGTDFSTADVDDKANVDETHNFFQEFTPAAESFNLEKLITDQDDVIRKADKKYSSLVDDQSDLEKQMKRLQQKLDDNRHEQEKQKATVEKERQAADVLKTRRKQS